MKKATLKLLEKLIETSKMQVKSAGLLESLDEDSKIRQEAYFEVITSEASYLRSLNVLITHFMASPHLMGAVSFNLFT